MNPLRMAYEEAVLQGRAARADLELARLARRDGTFVVGPWLSEVGFELLYWRPLVRRWMERHEIGPERVVVVSRGGAGAWYAGMCRAAHDIFATHTPDDLRRSQEERYAATRAQKQLTVRAFDRDVLAPVLAGIEGPTTLVHPWTMYRLIEPVWARRRAIGFLERRAAWTPIERPAGTAEVAGLPEEYVAVKAYFSACFPDTPVNRRFLDELIGGLAETTDVVLLSTGVRVDDHSEWEPPAHPRIVTLAGRLRPEDNLAVQTEVIRGARALYGTYGGFSYLAPFVGVPSWCFFSERNFNGVHLDAMERAAAALRRAGLPGAFTATTVAGASELLRLA